MRSDIVKLGDARAPHRSLLRAVGLNDDDFGKPFIAVCNSHIDIIPGHVHLDKVGAVRQAVRPRGGRRAVHLQHDRRRRRHRHGPRGHEVLAAQPRADRRLGRDDAPRPRLRRHDLHSELRQDHARHVDGRDALQHPDDLRQRRSDGGRQNARREDGRSDRRLHRRGGRSRTAN